MKYWTVTRGIRVPCSSLSYRPACLSICPSSLQGLLRPAERQHCAEWGHSRGKDKSGPCSLLAYGLVAKLNKSKTIKVIKN